MAAEPGQEEDLVVEETGQKHCISLHLGLFQPPYSECVQDNQAYRPEESAQAWTVYCREETGKLKQIIPFASETHIRATESLHSEKQRPCVQPYATLLLWFVVTFLGIAGLVFPIHAVSLTVSYMFLRGTFGLLTLDAAIPKVEHSKPPSLAHFTFDVIGYLWYTISLGSTTFLITTVPFRYSALLMDQCSILVVDTLFVIVALCLRFYLSMGIYSHPETSDTCS